MENKENDVVEVKFSVDENGNEVVTPSWYADILESHKSYAEESKKKVAELESALEDNHPFFKYQ